MLNDVIEYIQKQAQVLKFIISGGIALGVNLAVLYIFTDILHIYYLISTVWAFIISFGVSFLLQKFWTFEDASHHRIHIQLPLYLGMQLMNLGLNALLMYTFVEYLHVWYLLSQVVISFILAFTTYFINKKYIFISAE